MGVKGCTDPPQRADIRAMASASLWLSPSPVQPGVPQTRPAKSAMGRMRFVGTEIPVTSTWAVKRGAPACPRLVKIWITPLDASVP